MRFAIVMLVRLVMLIRVRRRMRRCLRRWYLLILAAVVMSRRMLVRLIGRAWVLRASLNVLNRYRSLVTVRLRRL